MKAFQSRNPGAAMAIVASAVALSLTACSPSSSDNGRQSPAPTAANTQSVAPAVANAALVAYTGSIPATATHKQCALDNISGQFAGSAAQLQTGTGAMFVGWAGNGKGQAANGFLLVLKGSQSYSVPLAMNIARPDVAKATSSDGMANSGYQVNASLSGVATGSYHIVIVDPADASNICDTDRDIVVQ
jgi:hypothetical protein